MNPRLPVRLLVLALALLAVPSARADACWAADVAEPVSNDDLPVRHRSFSLLHAALDVVETMLRSNPGLLALPEVRLRQKRQVMDAIDPARMPREAVLHAQGFGPKAWGRGDCDVISQADRLGPKAGISVFLNSPTVTLNRWEHDEQLVSYLEGAPTPSFQGWPTFRECAVLSADRRLPWVPVTVGEMLAYFEREQQRKLVDWDRRHEQALQPFDLEAAEREAARVRPLNAPAADAILLVARQRKDGEARTHAQLRAQREMLVAELQALGQTRASLGAERLGEPYRIGTGKHRLPTPAEADRVLPRVVKLDPSFPWDGKRRARIQLVTVCAPQQQMKDPRYATAMREAVAALDFARLAALLH